MPWIFRQANRVRPHSVISITYPCVKGLRPRSGLACRDIASVLDSPLNDDPQPREVQITGHIRTVRSQKKRAFVSLGDGTTTRSLQALLDPPQAAGYVRSHCVCDLSFLIPIFFLSLQARNRYGGDHFRNMDAIARGQGTIARVACAYSGRAGRRGS